jgi:Mrp family chromosome partitioning ATPase
MLGRRSSRFSPLGNCHLTSRGTEELKAAFRRSLRLIVGLIVLGIVLVNLLEQVKGPTYEAVSKVEVPATSLAQIISGTQSSFVDPQRSQDTAAAIATSPKVYATAATQTANALGNAQALQDATSVSEVPDTDILAFTASDSDASKAQKVANAVAQGYVTFSGQNATQTIRATIATLQGTLSTLPAGPQRTQEQNQINRLELLQGASADVATIIQTAVSADKTSPAPAKDTVLGLVLGLVVALIVVAVREAVDTKVRSESDVEEILSAPVITRVRPLPKRVRMVSYGQHQAAYADAYSLLAAQIAPAKDLHKSKVIAVTSSVAQEGKTSTSANLAVALARRGADVILADFDFRKPDMNRLFNIPPDVPGSLQIFSGEVNLNGALWQVSLDGMEPEASRNGHLPSTNGSGDTPDAALPHGSLRVLPAGGILAADREGQAEPPPLRPLLQLLRMRATTVIVDTAPALLTADMTDFAERIDTTIVVVRQGFASRRNLRLLAQQAENWPTRVAGAVLTDVDLPNELASYYGVR